MGKGFLGSAALDELTPEEQEAIIKARDAPDFQAPKGQGFKSIPAGGERHA
jgi:hypothetical protein